MGDGPDLPSTLTYGQTIEWIANSIGHFMSNAHIAREMRHLNDNDFGVEPPLNLIITRLGWAELDYPASWAPTMSISEAVQQAREQLYDALCSGRVTMIGHPNWEPAHSVQAVPQLECTNLRFREDGNGVVTAAVKTNPNAFWSAIRFNSAEIDRGWPARSIAAPEIQEKAEPDVALIVQEREASSKQAIMSRRMPRKRGPKGDLRRRIKQAMRDAFSEGYDLQGALGKELPEKFGGGHTTCRDAREDVLAEIDSGNLRQTPQNEK